MKKIIVPFIVIAAVSVSVMVYIGNDKSADDSAYVLSGAIEAVEIGDHQNVNQNFQTDLRRGIGRRPFDSQRQRTNKIDYRAYVAEILPLSRSDTS